MRSRFYQRKRKQGLSSPEITLTPLIDTAFVLLVIFMVTSPMMEKKAGLQVELPKGNVDELNGATEDLVVLLDAKDKIFFNGKEISPENLIEKLKKLVTKNNEKTVFVKADVKAHYGKVIELIDRIKYIGGVKYVGLATSKFS